MCCIYENTNFESNSQPNRKRRGTLSCCVVSTKIQILKAIHNYYVLIVFCNIVVLYLRKYKFWKQFTTSRFLVWFLTQLCCIYENTNFESNSQLIPMIGQIGLRCVVSTKIQILKAIHNWNISVRIKKVVVLYLRKYKFWKQFTTIRRKLWLFDSLCCIYENTNFESNSQPVFLVVKIWVGCVVSTKIQILKAIHNFDGVNCVLCSVVLYLRKYKFWKQFTTYSQYLQPLT